MIFRQFQKKDQLDARQLILEGLGERFGFINETINPDLDDIGQTYVAKGDAFLVAEHEGLLVATGALIQEQDGIGRLVRMSVAKAARRNGIATQMIDRLIEVAVGRAFRQILVETNWDWHEASSLYLNYGFSEYDRDDVSVYLRLDLPELNPS